MMCLEVAPRQKAGDQLQKSAEEKHGADTPVIGGIVTRHRQQGSLRHFDGTGGEKAFLGHGRTRGKKCIIIIIVAGDC